jgi:hypothetical protein
MIDVPLAAILPGHPWQKERFEVSYKINNRIADQGLPGPTRLAILQTVPNSGTHPRRDGQPYVGLPTITPIDRQPIFATFYLMRQHLALEKICTLGAAELSLKYFNDRRSTVFA